ncbi:ATP-binding protein [Neobacillus sp. PS3-40]|uniref:ATP-binding protein n=1 Tax=Neobacillus sp. PS3-40 TaxID=3070679 RepID=UPI0027E01B82|nr:ATP-binding protein [Neobacillus sp. PS3-40]WML44100.1 ATP-binding protein [Neobacillus sp. PS3-40]
MDNLRKIESIKLSKYFAYQKNKMITYRIIPHISVTNNQNSKMWRVLHKMYEIYDKIPSRLSRNGFKFTFREKDSIWFDVIFRQENNEKKIEFYVSTSELWGKKFKEILENYMKVTIEEVETKAIEIPDSKNTVLQEIRLSRHDIFSLGVKASEQTTPIASLLTALDDISMDGDFARLSIYTETFDRKKWAQNGHWAHEKIQKGKVPVRARITPSKVQKALKTGISTIANEVYDVLNDIMDAISNTFFKSEKGFEKKKIIDKKHALIEELNSSTVTQKSTEKLNQPVFKTFIRVAAVTDNKLRGDLIANTISSAFSEIAGDNELLPFKIRLKSRKREVINELNTLHLSKNTKADGDVSLLSCDEIAKVAIQMPTSIIQQRYENELAVNKKVETDISPIFIHKEKKPGVRIGDIIINIGSNNIKFNDKILKIHELKSNSILVGHSEFKGKEYPIGIPLSNPEETYKGYVATGGMGSGKDTFIQNFVTEAAINHNISFVVIDQVNKEGLQGMANGIRDSLPPEKVIDIDLSDENYLPPLDLTEVMEKLGRKGADRFANELIDFFQDLEGMGQSRKILRTFAQASNGSLYNIKRLLEEESFRKETAQRLRNEGKRRVAEEIEKFISENELVEKRNTKGEVTSSDWKCTKDGQKSLDGKASAIFNRLDEFMGDSTLFEIFAQPPKAEMNLEQWMREGKVIIFRVPDRILSTVAVRTLVHWITLKVLMTRMLMTVKSQGNGAFIIFNEPQTYLSENKGLAKLLSRIAVQGRKERLGSIFACHHLGQIKEISEDLISGGVNWLLFKNDNENTFKSLETQLQPITVETALNIPNTKTTRHAICIMNFGGERKPAFMVRMLKPSYERYKPYDNSFLTKRHSRLFGRHFDEIEKIIDEQEIKSG